MAMPFDLVAEVRCFFGVLRASSKANLQDAVDADAGEHRLLHDELALGAPEHAAADGGILTFGILPHHPEIDVAGLAIGERRRHAGHQPHRPQIDVLVELAAELNERAPQRDVIGNFRRPADGAEEDRVMAADLVLPVLRHHALVLGVIIVGGEVEMIVAQLEAEFLGGGLENAHALRHHLLADAVARNDRDPIDAICGHAASFQCMKPRGEQTAFAHASTDSKLSTLVRQRALRRALRVAASGRRAALCLRRRATRTGIVWAFGIFEAFSGWQM